MKPKNFIILTILFLIPFAVFAQLPKCTIIGNVVDSENEPISYASVAVLCQSTPIAGAVTDENGNFSISINTEQYNDSLQLVIDFIGFEKIKRPIKPCNPKIDIGIISLQESSFILNNVVVTASETAKKSTIEHTTINASANHAYSKGSAMDLLQTASSVNISNDVISIRGSSNILVLLDGIPTTVSDLSTIPAVNIKSIEVVTNPDASYDASGTGGIINIISKKTQDKGFSGMIVANYGFNHFVSGNLMIAYNLPKTSWRFSYNTKYEDDEINTSLNRLIKNNEHQIDQQMQTTKYTFNNNIGLGADFRINPNNRLSIDLKCIIPRQNIEQNLQNMYTIDNTISNEYRYNDVTWNRTNFEASIGYTGIIKPNISDITIKASLSKIWGRRPSYYYIDNQPINRSNSGGSPFIPAIQADYKHMFNVGTFSSGVKFTYRSNDIYHQFYVMENEDWVNFDPLSNDLLHTEFVPAAYAMFSSRVGKKFSYKVGARGEFSSVTLNSIHENINKRNNSFFFAPSLSASYQPNNNNDLSLAFSRRIGRPTYPQLNPYMSMVDAVTYEQGNMHLVPEKSSKIDISYNLKSDYVQLFADAYLNYTTDYISQVTTINNDRLITTYINAEADLKSGIDLSLKITPFNWLNATISANTYYVSTKGIYAGADIQNQGWTNNSNLLINLSPWKDADIQIQYFVTTPQYFPQLTTSLIHQMNVGLKQQLLNKAMTISLLMTDLFNTYKWEVYSHNNFFDLKNYSKGKSRMLWLGVSYNFNSFKHKTIKKPEDDRNLIRLGL